MDHEPYFPNFEARQRAAIADSQSWAESRAAEDRRAQLGSLEDIASYTQEVHQATLAVHGEVQRLATETAKAQRLAIWVGVTTGVVGSVLGGFAGAVAARIVGQ